MRLGFLLISFSLGFLGLSPGQPRLSGFVQPGFEYEFGDDPRSSFSVNRATIEFESQLLPLIGGRVTADLARTEPLLDAYLQLGVPGKFELRVGQFKVPQGLERLTPETELGLIEYSLTTRKLTSLRDIGVQIGVHSPRFGIELGLFNGEGPNSWDRNDHKDGVARVRLKPLRFVGLGGSYYLGKTGPEWRLIDRRILGAELEMEIERLSLKGELLGGVNGATELQGFYLQAGYRVWPQVQPVLRYERFDPNLNRPGDGVEIITLGLNLFLIGHNKLQINYLLKEDSPVEDGELLVQFQVQI